MTPKSPHLAPPSRLARHLSLRTPPSGKCRAVALVIVLAGVLVANVIPDGPTGHLAYAQTADSSIEFAENGMGPVGIFYAYDQDGDAIVWSLRGPDADQFTIGWRRAGL